MFIFYDIIGDKCTYRLEEFTIIRLVITVSGAQNSKADNIILAILEEVLVMGSFYAGDASYQ